MVMSLSACSSGGVSQEEYDKVVAERDEYKALLEEIGAGGTDTSSGQLQSEWMETAEKEETKEFGVGETWEVEGKFKVTVNSVITTDYRNEYDESNPSAVYIVNYTYENIGIENELYVSFENKVVDNGGKMASSYPGDIDKYATYVPTGAYCEAEACIGVENAGSFKDYITVYDDEYNEHYAVFNLEVQ